MEMGIGDLQGIIQRLPYLQQLGIKAIWISPIYPSPMADFGYDISDYEGIWSTFGTMADFDQLLQQVHAAGMRLILDLVPNHSSDEHPGSSNPAVPATTPNGTGISGKTPGQMAARPIIGSAYSVAAPGNGTKRQKQYYYHAFLVKQPDLNWRNPEVEKAMLNIMRFWLDKGVDGFVSMPCGTS